MEKLLTAHELAEALNLSVETIWRYTRQKRIPVIELGKKQYRYKKEAVLAALNKGGEFVKEELSTYSKEGGYTYEDYLKIQDQSGYRYEVLEGILIKEPTPSVRHQRVLTRLLRQLADFFDDYDPEGEVIVAPLEVTLDYRNVLQPDIMFVSGTRKEIIREERIDGACDLVIEIMSPKYRRKDRLKKMEVYRGAGIPHYWLVDPTDDTLEAYMLKEGHYVLITAVGTGDEFAHPEFPGLKLFLEKIFYRSASC